jgi:hypothetical protein
MKGIKEGKNSALYDLTGFRQVSVVGWTQGKRAVTEKYFCC